MSLPPRILIALTIITLLMLGLHYYSYARIARYLMLDPQRRLVLKVVLAGLFAIVWCAMPMTILLRIRPPRLLYWAGYIWLGSLIIMSVVLLGGDIARLVLAGSLRLWGGAEGVDPQRRTLLTRTLELATLGTAGSLIGYALYHGLRRIAVRKVALTLPKLPTELGGFRIVQITDIHVGPTIDGQWLRRMVAQVNALNPDVVAITGDLVDGPVSRLREHVAPIGELRARHGVYFVTGNHEYYAGVDEWMAELGRLGLRVLRNERVTVPASGSGAGIDLLGVDDFHSHTFPGHGPDLPRAVAGRNAQNPAVLLAHQPLAVLEAARLGVDLQLSGHTHGGQIWPWGYFVRLQQPYVAGLHRHGDTHLYVSCGTGYWGPPMRLGAPAEITEITLHCQAA